MDHRLRNLRNDFMRMAADAVEALQRSGIEPPETNVEWATRGISRAGRINTGGSYRKHGYGCAVRLGHLEVDFDFNETGGIKEPDAFRLINFCGARFAGYGFTSEHDLVSVVATDI